MYNIAIIGGGVIGTTTALQIQKDIKNSKITLFAEKLSPKTTGDVSAGFWTPYLLGDTPKSNIAKWSKVTYEKFYKLWRDGKAIETGICLQSVLRLFTDEIIDTPDWIKTPFGACMLSPEQVQQISTQHNKKYTGASHFVSFSCEPVKLLPILMQEFLNNGGNLINKRINNFSELSDYDVIVNCSGVEARKLTNDTDIHPIRGQVCRVKAPWQFQIISDESDDGYYVIPNTSYVILGGTHQEHDYNLTVSLSDKDDILKGCAKISAGLINCVEHVDGVGLRPGRSQVRLESEKVDLGNKTLNIVHNYGHGGAGVTLSFGCAVEASELVQDSLNIRKLTSHL